MNYFLTPQTLPCANCGKKPGFYGGLGYTVLVCSKACLHRLDVKIRSGYIHPDSCRDLFTIYPSDREKALRLELSIARRMLKNSRK